MMEPPPGTTPISIADFTELRASSYLNADEKNERSQTKKKTRLRDFKDGSTSKLTKENELKEVGRTIARK